MASAIQLFIKSKVEGKLPNAGTVRDGDVGITADRFRSDAIIDDLCKTIVFHYTNLFAGMERHPFSESSALYTAIVNPIGEGVAFHDAAVFIERPIETES